VNRDITWAKKKRVNRVWTVKYIVICVYAANIYVQPQAIGQVFPIAFMNITPDTDDAGYIQLYVVAPNDTVLHVQVKLNAHFSTVACQCLNMPSIHGDKNLKLTLSNRILFCPRTEREAPYLDKSRADMGETARCRCKFRSIRSVQVVVFLWYL